MLYIGRTYNESADVVRALDKLEDVNWKTVTGKPETPEYTDATNKVMDPTDKMVWEGECKRFADRKEQYRRNMSKAFYLLWGQCTDPLQAKIKSMSDYDTIKDKCDSIALLKNIKLSIFKFETTRYPYASIQTALSKFLMFR